MLSIIAGEMRESDVRRSDDYRLRPPARLHEAAKQSVAVDGGAPAAGFYGHPGEDRDLDTYRRLSRAPRPPPAGAAEADAALDYARVSGYGGRRESADLTRMTALRTQAAQL